MFESSAFTRCFFKLIYYYRCCFVVDVNRLEGNTFHARKSECNFKYFCGLVLVTETLGIYLRGGDVYNNVNIQCDQKFIFQLKSIRINLNLILILKDKIVVDLLVNYF